jgi:hypothetical protein
MAVIVGVVLIYGGLGVSFSGFLLGSIGGFASEEASEFVLAFVGGLAMALLGSVLCLRGAKGHRNQEKKDGVPEVRSSNEWVCRNCGSQNKQGLDRCIWCGADVK